LNSTGATLNLGADSTLSGTISGAGGITKTDATTLTLSGANNYTGATIVNAGTLKQGAANSIPSGSAVVLDGGGKLALNGFNATIGSISNTGTGATDTITTGGANLTVGGDNTDTLFKGNIDGGASGTFTKVGSGILQISGVGSTLIGGGANWVINTDPFQPINVNGGVLQFNGLTTGSLELGSDVNVAAGATVALGGSYKTSYAVHGAGSLQINGGSGIELTVPNDYTGGTKIRGATVTVDTMDAMGPAGTPIDILPQLGSATAGSSSTIKFATDGTFSHPVNMPANGYYTINFNAANQNVTLDQGVTGASQIYYSNGTFTINAKNTNSGATNVHPAATTVKLGIDDAFNSKYFTLVNGTLDLNGHNLAVGSLIGNSGGKIILSAGNTLTTGLDNVDSQNISSGSYGGGYSGVMTGAGGLTKVGTGQALMTMKYDANNLPYTGPTHVEQGTLWFNIDARSASGTSGFTVDPGALLIFGFTKAGSGGVAPHIDQVITGGGAVQKNNNNETLELTADNTYTGGTNITAGSLIVSKDSNLGDVSGPVRFLNAGISQTLQFTNGLTTSRNLISASPNAIVDTNGFDVQVGNIDGNTDPRLPIGAFAKSTGAGTLTATHVRVDALSVNAGTLKIAAGGGNGGVSSARTVTTADGALLDLTDNKLIVTAPDSTGTWNGSAYDGVSGLVQSARGTGNWSGTTGITSSSAASNPNPKLFSIGVVKAGDIKSIADDATATFAGQTIHGSDTLAMYTYGGDANLDGKINIDDYGLIDSHVGQSGTAFGWHNGDFNYDGKINIDDYGIIDGNIGAQGAPIPTAAQSLAGIAQIDGVSAVPEPASLGLIALAGAGLLRRRRRQI
jgi:autotransporter-associated beta strand protein